LPSFRTKISERRQAFLLLASQIEEQLRDAYDRRFKAGEATQSSLAKKLGVNRSAVHRRLMGHTNMATETLASMAWALGCDVRVDICDKVYRPGQNHFVEDTDVAAEDVDDNWRVKLDNPSPLSFNGQVIISDDEDPDEEDTEGATEPKQATVTWAEMK
jgi:hypothetical protein